MSEPSPKTPRERRYRWPAIAIFGPTGTGKTPLGQCIEVRGLWGRRWRHFDFGEQLRRSADEAETGSPFTPAERHAVRRILEEHRLLRAEELWIAERILHGFEKDLRSSAVHQLQGVVLNGLPRNIQQAEVIEQYFDVRLILELSADPETISARLRTNRGGDRLGRSDDTPAAVARKLDWYRQETQPLIEYYRRSGIPAMQISISQDATPEQTYRAVADSIAALSHAIGPTNWNGSPSKPE